jgi:hypothetical protein
MTASTASLTTITALLALLFVVAHPSSAIPPGWPDTISTESGFADLGRAIRNEPDFPASGTRIERARYVFLRLRDVAQSYGLKPGSGKPLSNLVIGLYRLTDDPEGAQCLKGAIGWGNCGEWSYAMSEILAGAGVTNFVAFGDESGGTGSSFFFTGTDTMVIVEERSRDGKVSRRVFDAFRATYRMPEDLPTARSLQEWGDMPLTDYDRWKDETRQSWQDRVVKPFIKEATTQMEIDLRPRPGVDPSDTHRPVAARGQEGTAVSGNRCTCEDWDDDGRYGVVLNGRVLRGNVGSYGDCMGVANELKPCTAQCTCEDWDDDGRYGVVLGGKVLRGNVGTYGECMRLANDLEQCGGLR